jgi:archaellum component FlaC
MDTPKWILALCVLLVLGFPLWGATDEGKVTSDELKKQAGEAIDAARKYAGQQKAEYQQKIEQELAELGENISKLRERAKSATGESLKAIEERIGDLRERQSAAQKKLGEVKAATEQAWSGLKEGMDKAVSELKKSYESAIGLFK